MTEPPRRRPRWSTVDTWPVLLLTLLAVLALGAPASEDTDPGLGTDDLETLGVGLFIAILIQQAVQFGWPWVVSKWKGLGLAADWKFSFDWKRDIGYGLGIAVVCVLSSATVTAIIGSLIGLSEEEDPSNTSLISDNVDSPWLIAVILLVVVGAPLSEELLYRGLTLRALERDFGVIVAVVGSTALFTLPHAQAGATASETIVLLGGISVIGLVLSLATVRFNRLGPAIIGHLFFNAFGTVVTLIG